MKRFWIVCMSAVMLILTACTPIVQPEDTTAPQMTTAAPEETTAPDTLSIEDCLLDDREPLSYEAFFAEDRTFLQLHYNADALSGWLYDYEGTQIYCIATFDADGNLIVKSDAFDEVYTVPCAEEFPYCTYLGADGKFVYLKNQEATAIVQVQLRTGEVKELVTAEKLLQAYICGRDLLYYAALEGDKISINRLYIPTMHTDRLYEDISADVPLDYVGFSFSAPNSTLGAIHWQTMTPEIMTLLKKELSDPDSKYRQFEGIAGLWEKEDPLETGYGVIWLMMQLQDDFGVRSLQKCTYQPLDGTYTEEKGIVDNCWTGTYRNHDHFHPEYTTVADPVLDIGPWEYPADKSPANADLDILVNDEGEITYETVFYSDQFGPSQLYLKKDGIYTLLSDKAFFNNTWNLITTKHYIYAITTDNTLLKINWETGKTVTLYTAKNGKLSNLAFSDGYLYFTDGDQLIEAEVSMGRYRVVLTHPHINCVSIGVRDHMYFELKRGLAIRAFEYCPVTESLKETTPFV